MISSQPIEERQLLITSNRDAHWAPEETRLPEVTQMLHCYVCPHKIQNNISIFLKASRASKGGAQRWSEVMESEDKQGWFLCSVSCTRKSSRISEVDFEAAILKVASFIEKKRRFTLHICTMYHANSLATPPSGGKEMRDVSHNLLHWWKVYPY